MISGYQSSGPVRGNSVGPGSSGVVVDEGAVMDVVVGPAVVVVDSVGVEVVGGALNTVVVTGCNGVVVVVVGFAVVVVGDSVVGVGGDGSVVEVVTGPVVVVESIVVDDVGTSVVVVVSLTIQAPK